MKKVILLIVGVLFTATLFAEKKHTLRLGGGPASGKYKFEDTTEMYTKGAFDQDLTGFASHFSYVRTTGNLVWGLGLWNLNLKGSSEGKTSGYTTHKIESFNTTFVFGLIGYQIASKNVYFQPNLRLGAANTGAKYSSTATTTIGGTTISIIDSQSKSTSGFGLGIELPIMFRISDSFGLGANAYISSVQGKIADSTQTRTFKGSNYVNLLIDFSF